MATTIAAAFRPLTATLSPAVLTLIRGAMPLHAEEHLVQAWDALSEAGTEEDPARFARLMSYARSRHAGAEHALRYVKGAVKARAAAEEVAHLARLIEQTR